MIDDQVVELSRLQFAITALYHFLFVPLTLGLSFLLAIMESVYLMTGREIYREMTQFWGKLFGINFAMGVATGITLEFQFGTNWAYYAHYVGDIFGAPLAIEGLMAFFLESTLVGLFFFGWKKLTPRQHLAVTWLLALGSNLSALWILIANAWMQNPVGAHFNLHTLRMELDSFSELLFNPVAQVKFVHTVAAGYVTGAIFMLALSSLYLLRGRHVAFALRSIAVASGFGLASALSVIVLGDESGYTVGDVQKVKLAAIEAEWHTEPAPAAFNVFALPDQDAQRNRAELRIPYLLGLMATRSLNEPVMGLHELVDRHEQRIRSGMSAYAALERLRAGESTPALRARFEEHGADLGYALLLKRYTRRVTDATPEQIHRAASDTVPRVAPLFWTFRIMVAAGLVMLFVTAASFYVMARGRTLQYRWLLRLSVLSLPLPWIAAECGWIVAEYGRQPWAIAGVLPTRLGVSSISAEQVWGSLLALGGLYTLLLVVELFLMVRTVRKGPGGMERLPFMTASV